MIYNQQVFRWRSLIETFADPQTWILCLMTCLISLPSGVITTYSSMLIRNFGFTPKEAALLNMPSGIVSIAFTILSTYVIARGWQRWVSIIACLIPTLVGASLMSFLPKTNQAGLLCGIYLVNAVSCFLFFPRPWFDFFGSLFSSTLVPCQCALVGFVPPLAAPPHISTAHSEAHCINHSFSKTR